MEEFPDLNPSDGCESYHSTPIEEKYGGVTYYAGAYQTCGHKPAAGNEIATLDKYDFSGDFSVTFKVESHGRWCCCFYLWLAEEISFRGYATDATSTWLMTCGPCLSVSWSYGGSKNIGDSSWTKARVSFGQPEPVADTCTFTTVVERESDGYVFTTYSGTVEKCSTLSSRHLQMSFGDCYNGSTAYSTIGAIESL